MTKMNKDKKASESSPLNDLLPIVIGEAIVAVVVCLGFGLLDFLELYSFDFRIVLGAILGVVVIVANHVMLIFAVDREIKKFIDNRPEGDMRDEDAQLFAKKKVSAIQNAMKKSSLTRNASMLVVLVIAFITKWFDPIATAIPMLAFRFVLTATELIKSKNNPKPDPSKFIKYEDEGENTEYTEEEDN